MTSGLPRVSYESISLAGGWDQISPSLTLAPGVARDPLNFECAVTGGYSRIAGYERYDGRTAPSSASYSMLTVATYTNTPAVGQTITGQTSGATGLLIAVNADSVAYTQATGSFQAGETINVGATSISTITALGAQVTSKQNAIYTAAAMDTYRSSIQPVPGSGGVLGVAVYNGITYAWRNNAGGTAAAMYKATAGGWSAVSLGYEVAFSNANTSVNQGDTLTQGGVTATINRVVVETGTLVSGTNTGRLIISAPAGGAFSAGAASSTGGGSLTLSGASAEITLSPGGRFETMNANFTGSSTTYRMYGVDGVNRAFEFDGTVFVPISTGASPDNPKHLAVHRSHLFLFIGSSAIHSGPGLPYNFSITAGGGEIAVGDEVTGALNQPGSQSSDSLAIYGSNNTFVLYGTSAANWSLTTFNRGTGARHYTAQNMASSYVLDDRGVNTLQTSLNYGNFEPAFLTYNIRKFIAEKFVKASASTVSRERSQYRVFFNDGYALFLTVANDQFKGAMPILFPNPVLCTAEGDDANGNEKIFFGSSNGYVYQMDVGPSFDGVAIPYSLTLNFDSMKSPRVRKRFRHCGLEVTGSSYAEVGFSYSIDYGGANVSQPGYVNYETPFAVPTWDSFTWDQFTWDGATIMPTECEMVGTGQNVALMFLGNKNYVQPFTINTAIVHFSVRRGVR